MSTDQHKHALAEGGRPVHQDVSYEPTDVRVSPILRFLIALGLMVVLSYIVTIGIYKGLKSFWASTYAPPPPSRLGATPEPPPEPRLQGMPGHRVDPGDGADGSAGHPQRRCANRDAIRRRGEADRPG